LRTAAAQHPAEQAAQQAAEAAVLPHVRRGPRELLGEVGHHDRREDRQQLLDQPRADTAHAAELLDDLVLLGAEHVADDLLPVVRVDLVEVHPALDEPRVVLLHGLGERRGAARVVGVGLDAAQQRGQRGAGRLLRLLLVDAELARQLVQRDLREDVLDCTHDAEPNSGSCLAVRSGSGSGSGSGTVRTSICSPR
jgi:hypothetical protein